MAMNAGSADCSSGLAKRIYDAWTGASGAGLVDLNDPANEDAKKSVQAICYAIALSVVTEITENARVVDTDRIE